MAGVLVGSLADVRTCHEVEDITFVRPDVALVSCIKHVTDQRTVPPATCQPRRV